MQFDPIESKGGGRHGGGRYRPSAPPLSPEELEAERSAAAARRRVRVDAAIANAKAREQAEDAKITWFRKKKA